MLNWRVRQNTNYVLWYPFEQGDERFGFRFVVDLAARLKDSLI